MYEKIIWMYWENKSGLTKPPYIELCLETIKCHKGSFEIKLLDEKIVTNYIDLPPIVNKFTDIAHKADYIRFMLLHKYGGIWLDSDIILLRNIDDAVITQLQEFDYVGYGREKGKPSIGFMAARKNCQLIGNQIEKIDEILRKKALRYFFNKKIKLGWTEIGYDILWAIAQKYDYFHHEFNMFAPTLWSDTKEFEKEDVEIETYLSHNPFASMLYNKMMIDSYQYLEKKEILNSDSLLSKIFKISLNNCTQNNKFALEINNFTR